MTERQNAATQMTTRAALDELIRGGLTAGQKSLPSALLYDDLGSALFEAITHLPEYELARADHRLLAGHAEQLLRAFERPLCIAELGPGGGAKARVVLEALRTMQDRVRFAPIDISPAALEECERLLSRLPGVSIEPVCGTYVDGLRRALSRRADGERWLVMFLGSNLSNFDRADALGFLKEVRGCLAPGDALLLATDLDKAPELLLPAYDDALGVTAAFCRNVLVRLNREWGAAFDLSAFAHDARWNATARRVEMHLRALRACEVRIESLAMTVSLAEGETIWTESSHRFDLAELRGWAADAGFECTRQWVDALWPFAHSVLVAKAPRG